MISTKQWQHCDGSRSQCMWSKVQGVLSPPTQTSLFIRDACAWLWCSLGTLVPDTIQAWTSILVPKTHDHCLQLIPILTHGSTEFYSLVSLCQSPKSSWINSPFSLLRISYDSLDSSGVFHWCKWTLCRRWFWSVTTPQHSCNINHLPGSRTSFWDS